MIKVNYKSFFSITSITFLASVISALFSIYILRLHISEMGVELRGKFVSIIVEIGVITAFVKFGTSQSIMYYLKKTDKLKLWTNYLVILFIQSLSLIFISSLIHLSGLGSFFHNVSLSLFTVIIITTFIYNSISWYVFLSENIKIYFFQIIIYVLTYYSSLNYILLKNDLDLELAFSALVFAQSCSILYLFISSSLFKINMIDKTFIIKIFKNGFKNLGWSYMKDIIYKIDIIIFSRTLNVKEFGYYTIIQNLAQFVWKFTDPIVSAYSKYVIRFDFNVIRKFYYKILKLFFAFFLLIIIPITILFSTQIFNVITGENLNNYRNMIIAFILSFIFFLLWKITAQTYVILNSVKNIYYSLFIFFLTFSISFIFINDEFYYYSIIISFITTTIFLIVSFYTFHYEKNIIKN